MLNPNLDLGCAKWCKQAADCLGIPVVADAAKQPLADTMIHEMKQTPRRRPETHLRRAGGAGLRRDAPGQLPGRSAGGQGGGDIS